MNVEVILQSFKQDRLLNSEIIPDGKYVRLFCSEGKKTQLKDHI